MAPDAPVTAADLRAFVAHIDHRLDTLHPELRDGFARVNPSTGQVGTRSPAPAPSMPLPTAPYVQVPAPPLSPFAAGYLLPRR